jgi:outer membrane protein OmpA-like peptidoglycan-associated protein
VAVIDIYLTAKANLRDNVKMLMTVFGGVAGALIAGTPFSGIGNLDHNSVAFWAALISLLLGFVVLAAALRVLLAVLSPDLAYENEWNGDFKEDTVPKEHRAEIDHLRAEFNKRKKFLLPPNAPDLDALAMLIETSRSAYKTAQQIEQDAAGQLTIETTKATLNSWMDVKTRINNWAAFTRMHFRYSNGIKNALWLGFLALALVAGFAIAVGAKDKPATPFVIVTGDQKPLAAEPWLPKIDPVLFQSGKFDLSADAIRIVGTARDHLRANPKSGVLIYAYTDTQGRAGTNRKLADRRAQSVARALISEGGIHPSRVFVTGLPETDLPKLTPQEMREDTNRAVQLVLIAVPARR